MDVLGLHGGGGSTGMLKRLWNPDSQLRSYYLRSRGKKTINTYVFGSKLMASFVARLFRECCSQKQLWKPKTSEIHVFLVKQRPLLAPSWKVSMESSMGLAGNLKQTDVVAKTSRKRADSWKSGVRHFVCATCMNIIYKSYSYARSPTRHIKL